MIVKFFITVFVIVMNSSLAYGHPHESPLHELTMHTNAWSGVSLFIICAIALGFWIYKKNR